MNQYMFISRRELILLLFYLIGASFLTFGTLQVRAQDCTIWDADSNSQVSLPDAINILRILATTANENGQFCSDSAECLSGHCVDGVCCDSSCSSTCYSCLATDTGGVDGACGIMTNGISCDDGNSCTFDDICSNGQCLGTATNDAYEPNDYPSQSVDLGTIDDTAIWEDADNIAGTVYPAEDVDWYQYTISDGEGSLSPRVSLRNIPAGINYNLCAYYECDNIGDYDVICDEGSLTSYDGMKGCCSTNSGSTPESVIFTPICSHEIFESNYNSGTVFIRVYPFDSVGSCDSYLVDWGNN